MFGMMPPPPMEGKPDLPTFPDPGRKKPRPKKESIIDKPGVFNPLNQKIQETGLPVLELDDEVEKLEIDNFDDIANDPVVSNMTEKPKFDVDDLVKRIDAKIAELEEQERMEKASGKQIDMDPMMGQMPDFNSGSPFPPFNQMPPMPQMEEIETNRTYDRFEDFNNEPKEEVTEAPIVSIDTDSVIVENESVTDDQFYDDFYEEEG